MRHADISSSGHLFGKRELHEQGLGVHAIYVELAGT